MIETLVQAQPDAIQLTIGQGRLLQQMPSDRKPALVLRTDVTNVYGRALPKTLFSHVMDDVVEQAVRIDAARVVVNLFRLPNELEVHRQCVRNISRLKPECERFGMPLMVEPLVMHSNNQSGRYMVDGDLRRIVALVRQATGRGADIIKADPCDNLEDYHEVVRAASGRRVLPRGGGKVSEREILETTRTLMDQGASGVVYGRNIIQHDHPDRMTQALLSVIHGNCSPEQAMEDRL